MQKSFDQLKNVREIKKAQIETFFSEREGDMGVLIEMVGTLRSEAMAKLEAIREIKKTQIESFFAERVWGTCSYWPTTLLCTRPTRISSPLSTTKVESPAGGSKGIPAKSLMPRSGIELSTADTSQPSNTIWNSTVITTCFSWTPNTEMSSFL